MSKFDALLRILDDENVQSALLLVDADSKEVLAAHRADERVVSASTIKVAIMLCALDKVRKGELSLTQRILVPQQNILEDSRIFEEGEQEMPLDELIRWMIIVSDNTATNALIRLLSMDAINAYCASIGLKHSRVERLMLDFEAVERGFNNYTSAQDQCNMFLKLYDHAILTPELCDHAMDVLLSQRDKEYFLRYLPQNLKVAHKTGSLDCLTHDSALFFLQTGRYYLGAFLWNAPNDDYAQRMLGRIGRCAVRTLTEGRE